VRLAIHWSAGDAEGSNFAQRLAEALENGGLKIMGGSPIGMLGQEIHGLLVTGHKQDEVESLSDALNDVGFGPINRQISQPPSRPIHSD
jgi:hypothetical protein